jgi:hypothetical protein
METTDVVRNVAYLRANKFQPFYALGIEGDELKAQLKAVDYIEQMANLLSIDLSRVDILETFKSREGKILQEKKAINAKLQTLCTFQSVERDANEVERAAMATMERALRRSQSARLDRLTREYTMYLERINSRVLALRETQASAWRTQETLMALRKQSFTAEQIDLIRKNDFWEILGARGEDYIEFRTKNDLVMTHKNPSAGLDIQVNLGKLIAELSLPDMWFSLRPNKDNVGNLFTRNGYYHPYASTSGSICWGNADGEAARLMASGKIHEALVLMQGLLTHYSPDTTPYESLENFHNAYLRSQGIEPPIRVRANGEWHCINCNYWTVPSRLACRNCGHARGNGAAEPEFNEPEGIYDDIEDDDVEYDDDGNEIEA